MKDKTIHEDQKYIVGLLENNTFIIQAIYEKFAPKVINYIKNNSGEEYEAKDVIQEVLITIYEQAKNNKLQLTCPFDAYFFLLCKRKWLNELKKSSKKEVTINIEVLSKGDDVSQQAYETEIFTEKQQLFNEMFSKLGDACRELLKATFELKSMEEVAGKLGVTYAYARKKKSLCIGKLTEMVRDSSAFKQIQNLL